MICKRLRCSISPLPYGSGRKETFLFLSILNRHEPVHILYITIVLLKALCALDTFVLSRYLGQCRRDGDVDWWLAKPVLIVAKITTWRPANENGEVLKL